MSDASNGGPDRATPVHVRAVRAMPILQVTDVRASAAFYETRLGFICHGFWGDPPAFAVLQRDGLSVALDQSQDAGEVPLNQYWAAYFYVDDVAALATEFEASGVTLHRTLQEQPYGCRDFDVRDPDGHIIAFGEDLAPSTAGPGLVPPEELRKAMAARQETDE